MVALLPAVIIGAVILIALGKLTLPKSAAEKKRDEEVDKKGFAGVVVDDTVGEGAAQALKDDIRDKGAVGVVHDGLFGTGTYEKLTTEIDNVERKRQEIVTGFWEGVAQAHKQVSDSFAAASRGISEWSAQAQAAVQKDAFLAGVAASFLPGGPIALAATAASRGERGA